MYIYIKRNRKGCIMKKRRRKKRRMSGWIRRRRERKDLHYPIPRIKERSQAWGIMPLILTTGEDYSFEASLGKNLNQLKLGMVCVSVIPTMLEE
jgi:hypothetical protein